MHVSQEHSSLNILFGEIRPKVLGQYPTLVTRLSVPESVVRVQDKIRQTRQSIFGWPCGGVHCAIQPYLHLFERNHGTPQPLPRLCDRTVERRSLRRPIQESQPRLRHGQAVRLCRHDGTWIPTCASTNTRQASSPTATYKQFGLRLLPELYEVYNPMPYDGARDMEVELAIGSA